PDPRQEVARGRAAARAGVRGDWGSTRQVADAPAGADLRHVPIGRGPRGDGRGAPSDRVPRGHRPPEPRTSAVDHRGGGGGRGGANITKTQPWPQSSPGRALKAIETEQGHTQITAKEAVTRWRAARRQPAGPHYRRADAVPLASLGSCLAEANRPRASLYQG